jgi:hypothetical protein
MILQQESDHDILSSHTSVTKQLVTAQWSFVVSDPDFCDHH